MGPILGDPGAASWGDRIFTGESLQQERDSPWASTLIERVPEAFKIPLADWPENQEALPFLLLTFARENPVAPTSCPWVSEDAWDQAF